MTKAQATVGTRVRAVLRREVKACAGDRFSARVDELRGMGFCILGPVKAPKRGIFQTTEQGPGGEDVYVLEGQ